MRSEAGIRSGPSSARRAKGWEKGSVEGGVKYVRNLVFRPRLAVERSIDGGWRGARPCEQGSGPTSRCLDYNGSQQDPLPRVRIWFP